jgi:hypothetical protein
MSLAVSGGRTVERRYFLTEGWARLRLHNTDRTADTSSCPYKVVTQPGKGRQCFWIRIRIQLASWIQTATGMRTQIELVNYFFTNLTDLLVFSLLQPSHPVLLQRETCSISQKIKLGGVGHFQ